MGGWGFGATAAAPTARGRGVYADGAVAGGGERSAACGGSLASMRDALDSDRFGGGSPCPARGVRGLPQRAGSVRQVESPRSAGRGSVRMNMRRSTRLLVLLLVLAGCSYLCKVERRAFGPDVTAAQLLEALSRIPAAETSEIRQAENVPRRTPDAQFRCARDGITADVTLTSDSGEIRVSVWRLNRTPDPQELALWRERVEFICARLSAAFPTLGSWDAMDVTEPPSIWEFVLIGLVIVGAIVAATLAWIAIIRRMLRRSESRARG